MSKKVLNRLKFLFAGVILLLILFNILDFAIPFDNKYNIVYWVSYGGMTIASLATIMFVMIAINADKYHNEACARKVLLFGCLYLVIQLIVSIVFMSVNSESLKSWIPIVITAVVFVAMVFLLIMAVIGSDGQEELEE